jgi:hypothetical protein
MENFSPVTESSLMSAISAGYAESYDFQPETNILNLVNDPGTELKNITNNNSGNDNTDKPSLAASCKIRFTNKTCSHCNICQNL